MSTYCTFAPGHPVSETGALLIMQRGIQKWSPGKVLPPRLLGVGQTRYYFTTGRKMAAGAGLAPAFAPSKGAVLRLDDPAIKWWPARVTRPVLRIKSPLHHFNACRPNWCSRQDLHLHWRRSRRRVSALDYASKLNGASSRCCSGRISLQKKSAGCCMEAKWSQSLVLPRARPAYDACLNAGSTAIVLKLEPPPGVAPS